MLRNSCLLTTLMFLVSSVNAAVQLPGHFSDHMVLQRDRQVPIWGTAEPGTSVTVSFAGQEVTTQTGSDGTWRVELDPLSVSTKSQTLTVHSKDCTDDLVIKNVLVGDVWVGSGQSNMAGRVGSYAKNDETLAALVQKAPFPTMRLLRSGARSTWTEATADAVRQFSALHFAFGERLQRDLDIPIGLIVGAVGGTPSGSWIPPSTFETSTKCKAVIAEFSKTFDRARAVQQYKTSLAAWDKRVADAKEKGTKPRGRKPQPPKNPGEASRGGKIGGLYERHISPVVGYAIRGVLWDQGEARTGVIGVDQHTMMSELIRGWREAWGQNEFPFLFVQKPSGAGCAFSNTNPITRNADRFTEKLPDINRIGSGEQRHLYVRLMRDNPNAWMVPASDLGSGIHPRNKWGYGNRAAEVALSQVYASRVQAYGPTYQSHEFVGDKVVIRFTHIGKGLVAAHSERLQGFALASKTGRWSWADATIAGDTVIIKIDPKMPPTAIRYAFSQNRQWANLFNKDGLPALAFNTQK